MKKYPKIILDSLAFQSVEVLQRLQNYTKFVFVRDPLQRLVSAYIDKFVSDTRSARLFQKYIGSRIQQSYREDNEQISDIGSGTSFPELAKYIIESSKKSVNGRQDHWEQIVRICQPCKARYRTSSCGIMYIIRVLAIIIIL